LYWDFSKLNNIDRAALESHARGCLRCQQAFSTIEALRKSLQNNDAILDSIDSAAFDKAVMTLLRRRPVPLAVMDIQSRQYNLRVAISFLAAAAVVLFLIKGISDLGPVDTARLAAPSTQDDARRVINIELGKRADSPQQFFSTRSAERASDEGVFSILPRPVTAPSPESVNIDAVFVAGDNIPVEQQKEAASLAEIYTDSGSVQAIAPQVSVLITAETMPRPIHVAVPEYPIWARKQGLSGNVWVKARVNADGGITEAQILSCDNLGVGFEEAAIEAALKSRFLPASANGMTFAVWVIYPVQFIFKS
jgi:TonB family protein